MDTGWKFGQPDVVLSMTEEASIPADGTVPYKYFTVPTNFHRRPNTCSFAEIKRGDTSVVHHVIVNVREPEQGTPQVAGEITSAQQQQRVNPEAAGQQPPRRASPTAC